MKTLGHFNLQICHDLTERDFEKRYNSQMSMPIRLSMKLNRVSAELFCKRQYKICRELYRKQFQQHFVLASISWFYRKTGLFTALCKPEL